MNNPLGLRAGAQKLGVVYVSPACLPPELLSINNIYLIVLFKINSKIGFGNSNIFKYIIKELHFLETTGIEICINNMIHNIFFNFGDSLNS